ncbi:hypothetical protein BC828DRAFT_384598 [Blastocladiella britannica]|nr:hypothetical protein BC828DRAFT_384598 [Blastocladiella britannica]
MNFERIAADMIEDLVLELVFEQHRNHKLAQQDCPRCGTRCRNFGAASTLLFPYDKAALDKERVECRVCKKTLLSSQFTKHLEKCMGLSTARNAGRRSAVAKTYTEDDTSPEKKKKKAGKLKSAASGDMADPSFTPDGTPGPTPPASETTSLQGDKPKRPPVKRRKKADAVDKEVASETGSTAAPDRPPPKKRTKKVVAPPPAEPSIAPPPAPQIYETITFADDFEFDL